MITYPNWFNHFNGLLNTAIPGSTDPQFAEYVAEALPLLESHAELATILNDPVTGVELRYVMKSLKLGKATYLDDVSNDAIKAGFAVIREALVHLFNNVLNSQVFPEPWNKGLIIPIHKKGDKLNTDSCHYIIIIVSSSVGKLFLKVMTSRIESHRDRLHRWCDNQYGFKKDHRIEDNLYILNSVYESHVSRGKGNIYLAFVDFTKFFNTTNREILYKKLLKYGICGPIYHKIKSMYSATSYRVKIGDHISPSFLAAFCVKQGCPMSPVLSNTYQNDLHEIFGENYDPVHIGDSRVNSISWADDLLLISTSKEGLQQCLENMKTYCYNWGLVVNTEKKTMVLSKQKYIPECFTYGGVTLQAT